MIVDIMFLGYHDVGDKYDMLVKKMSPKTNLCFKWIKVGIIKLVKIEIICPWLEKVFHLKCSTLIGSNRNDL